MAFVLAAVTGLALALMAAFESADTANLADIAPLPVPSGTSATRAGGGRHGVREPGVHAVHARVSIDAAAHLGRIPTSFLGISTEYGALSLFEQHASLFARVLSLLRTRGEGPLIVRVGGAHLASIVANAVGMAHRAGLAFRLTELNSVNCGGLPGVSNTFATALWVPDALFELMRGGVNGVKILFARTLGPHAQLAHVEVHSPSTANLKVWAVRVAGGRLHVLVLDKSDHPVHVGLRLRAGGAATVQRLLAPSVRSRFGVRLCAS